MTYDGDGNPVVASPANPALDQLFMGCRLTLVDPPLQDYAARNPAAFRWGDLQRVFDFTKGDVMIGRGRIESYLGFEKGMTPTEAEIVEEIRNRERWNDPRKNVGFIRFTLWDEPAGQFVEGFIYARSGVSLLETAGHPALLRFLDGQPHPESAGGPDIPDFMSHVESKCLSILLAYFGPEGLTYKTKTQQSSINLFTERPPCKDCHARIVFFIQNFETLIFDYPHWDFEAYPLVWSPVSHRYTYKIWTGSAMYLFKYFGLEYTDHQDWDTSPLIAWLEGWCQDEWLNDLRNFDE